jgi:hypothetical protein
MISTLEFIHSAPIGGLNRERRFAAIRSSRLLHQWEVTR